MIGRYSVVRPVALGQWSGGGWVVLNNLRYVAERFPDRLSFDADEAIPLYLRHGVPPNLLRSGQFLYMPQNAWVWNGPYGRPSEALRKLALRAASDLALRRTAGLIRISEAIPDPNESGGPILHNVLDERFESDLREAASIRTDVHDAVVCLGSLGTYRNVRRLLEAFEEYRLNGGQLRLVIQGPAVRPLPRAIREAAESRPYIEINPSSLKRPQVLAMFRDCRIAVFPALVEASSVTLLEALCTGERVIASDIQGHRGVAGGMLRKNALFDPTNVPSIASSLALAETRPTRGLPRQIASPEARSQRRDDWADLLIRLFDSFMG